LVITGSFDGNTTFGAGEENETTLHSIGVNELFIAKYGPTGELLWARCSEGGGNITGAGAAAFPDGSTVITGDFSGVKTFGVGEDNVTTLKALDSRDMFLAKYDPDGTFSWVRTAGFYGVVYANGIEVLTGGDIFITGYADSGSVFGQGEINETSLYGGRSAFVARFTP